MTLLRSPEASFAVGSLVVTDGLGDGDGDGLEDAFGLDDDDGVGDGVELALAPPSARAPAA